MHEFTRSRGSLNPSFDRGKLNGKIVETEPRFFNEKLKKAASTNAMD